VFIASDRCLALPTDFDQLTVISACDVLNEEDVGKARELAAREDQGERERDAARKSRARRLRSSAHPVHD
jgi:hypothetical protein